MLDVTTDGQKEYPAGMLSLQRVERLRQQTLKQSLNLPRGLARTRPAKNAGQEGTRCFDTPFGYSAVTVARPMRFLKGQPS